MSSTPPDKTNKAAPARKSRRKPSVPDPKRSSEVAENTLSKMQGKEGPEIKVETPEPNKYAPKKRISTGTVGSTTNYIDTVGLGKLRVINAHGNTDV